MMSTKVEMSQATVAAGMIPNAFNLIVDVRAYLELINMIRDVGGLRYLGGKSTCTKRMNAYLVLLEHETSHTTYQAYRGNWLHYRFDRFLVLVIQVLANSRVKVSRTIMTTD
jgi:hypothetical protein